MAKEKQTEPAHPDLESDSTAQATPDEQADKEQPSKRSKITADLMTRPSFMAAHTAMSFIPDSMKAYGPANIVTMHEEYAGHR